MEGCCTLTLVTGTTVQTTVCTETTVAQPLIMAFQSSTGNREVYHNNKQPFFKAIYTAMRDFKPGDDKKLLAKSLADHLHAVSDPYCGIMAESVLKYPKLSLV
ncbi:Glucoside xylosyltransferase 1 [Desmophyllum pertusum]|uniref:Glucoside xylosyltransferase 1 n=1 Tax=Desmophyllum pertusum TaxID=174260 RepID=A0A9X0CVS9_9CNID|nr:Glucoside xylosyltransferase 1 [Desmophyllum pertusum]